MAGSGMKVVESGCRTKRETGRNERTQRKTEEKSEHGETDRRKRIN
jgi:hypothetical protein